jgi:protein O-GlcNAc transferase
MNQRTIDKIMVKSQQQAAAFKEALRHYMDGDTSSAEALCQEVLSNRPEDAEAIHLMGLIARRRGSHDLAMVRMVRAISIAPSNPAFYNNLGNILRDRGELGTAAENYRKALVLKPDSAETRYNLGLVCQVQGDLDQAVREYRSVVQYHPDFVEAYLSMGNVLRDQGKVEEACACYRAALERRPGWMEAHRDYAFCLRRMGRNEDAAEHYRACLQQGPDCVEAHNNLGNICVDEGRVDDAIRHYTEAIRLEPLKAETHHNLGTALILKWRVQEAVQKFQEALEINPAMAHAHSNLLFNMHYHSADRAEELFAEHVRWSRRHAEPLAGTARPHSNRKDPDRRLRIGYVSQDFRDHPVARFILPLLSSHDRRRFQVFCYGDEVKPDSITRQCQSSADCWVDVTRMRDEEVADRIREDRIDILVDLAGHTTHHRLLVFARKPSPVQCTYLGYPNTTGLRAVDYRITDACADPPGLADPYYAEALIRLPHGFLCYQPPLKSQPVLDLPASKTGVVAFGSFNNLCKVTPRVIDLWARVLRSVPHSILKLKSFLLDDEEVRDRVRGLFEEQGIGGDRIHVTGHVRSHEEHLALYNEVDIALDPFPYHGTMTTCEALWMGVPVVVGPGKSHASRVGLSILSHGGLKEFVAESSDDYVRIASTMAKDLSGLGWLRRNLRQRLAGSSLLNVGTFVSAMEDAFCRAWQRWCSG